MLIVYDEIINEYGITVALSEFYKVPIEDIELRTNGKGEVEAFIYYRNRGYAEQQITVTASTNEEIEFSALSFKQKDKYIRSPKAGSKKQKRKE